MYFIRAIFTPENLLKTDHVDADEVEDQID